jgi:hypothetical protein
MNLRQKAKRYKGTYLYNLTVCKGYEKQINRLKKTIKDLEEGKIKEMEEPTAEDLSVDWPEVVEVPNA